MPHNIDELVTMIAKRDNISENDARILVEDTARELEWAFQSGTLEDIEDIMREELGLEPDYLDLFIY